MSNEWGPWTSCDASFPDLGSYIQLETQCEFCGKHKAQWEGIILNSSGSFTEFREKFRLVLGDDTEPCAMEALHYRLRKPPAKNMDIRVKKEEPINA